MDPRAWLLLLASAACAAPAPAELTWEEWRAALLRSHAPGELPPIPTEGWRLAAPGAWLRYGAEVADRNLDGRVDYLRVADPPNSYRHYIWVDLDHDGRFDSDPGIVVPEDRINPRSRVPRFTLTEPTDS